MEHGHMVCEKCMEQCLLQNTINCPLCRQYSTCIVHSIKMNESYVKRQIAAERKQNLHANDD